MKAHDALVLPSIVEGRALVQQEALACRLPIIVTPNAGGEDLVEEGITGHLVPIRSPWKSGKKRPAKSPPSGVPHAHKAMLRAPPKTIL